MSKDDLRKLTLKTLRESAKEHNITGRWDMNKEALVEALDKAINGDIQTQPEGSVNVTATTDSYISHIEVGDLLAFKVITKRGESALSGKFIKLIENDSWEGEPGEDTYAVETKSGTKYYILHSDILWVKTGAKWPKWVYELFKLNTKEVETIG